MVGYTLYLPTCDHILLGLVAQLLGNPQSNPVYNSLSNAEVQTTGICLLLCITDILKRYLCGLNSWKINILTAQNLKP